MNIFDRFKSDPAVTQLHLLRELLRKGAETEWGMRYGFSDIVQDVNPIRAYQDQVPVHSYEDYRIDVGRVRTGGRDVFWPGTFHHFAISSGTASEGRIIPVSREMLHLNSRFALSVGRAYVNAGGLTDAAYGRVLSVPGRIEEDADRPGIWIGEVSGLLWLFSPWLVRTCYEAVSRDVLFRPDWSRKLDEIVDATLVQDIRVIVMVPSWAVVLFRKLIDRFNIRYGRHVKYVHEIWPNLRVFFSGGVALSSYRDLLAQQIGIPDFHFVESYGASEGFFAFQDRLDEPDMLVHLENGVFMEFVRQDDGSEPPRRYTIGEVETGVRYQLFVTTCSGLWSYGIGDIIQFTSTDPHRIVVSGRTNEMMDMYGEAVFGDEAREALEKACRTTLSSVRDYHIAPIPLSATRMPGHQWLVEFEQPPDDLGTFAAVIDTHLQAINRHYVIRRESNAFTAPDVVSVVPGTFYRWLLQTRKSVGAQTKVPRMADDRRIADEVLSISRNKT